MCLKEVLAVDIKCRVRMDEKTLNKDVFKTMAADWVSRIKFI